LEVQASEAPRIIKGLRQEVSHLKSKIKMYFAQIGEDTRTIRSLDEERHRMKLHAEKLELLVADKNLADRDTLNTQLTESQHKVSNLELSLSVSLS
jgi:regulator of replication initiation timing